MDEINNQENPKQNSPNYQTTALRQSSTTQFSPNLSDDDDTSSPESVITDLKADMLLLNYQEEERLTAVASPGKQFQSPRFSCCEAAGRLPGSIFTRPGTPGEWSVASNESLFSIHVGNFSCTSFSATPMFRSGELTNTDLQHETPTFTRINEALCNAHNCAWPRAAAAADARLRSHLSTQSFQFPVLPGGRDGGWISSPKMLEMKRQRMAEQVLQPPQQPLLHIMQRRKEPQRSPKPKNNISYSSLFSRFFCFSKYCCTCTPCRRN